MAYHIFFHDLVVAQSIDKCALSTLYACYLVTKQVKARLIVRLSIRIELVMDEGQRERRQSEREFKERLSSGNDSDLIVVERGGDSTIADCGHDMQGFQLGC